jgi:RecA/RadA recombinase
VLDGLDIFGSDATVKTFTQPGAVGSAFMNSNARIVGIMGPQGGGKTTIIINKILQKAAMQPVSPVDGIARYRCIVWMRTYRELWAKVIPDWLEWVPKQNKAFKIIWTGGVDNPAEQKFMFRAIVDGVEKIVKAEIWFRAIGDQTPTEAAKGLHATDAWLPESTSATAEMRKALFGRLGRYPSREHGGAPLRQMFCDWNAGDPYNWTSEFFVYERSLAKDDEGRPMVAFFRQPGGRETTAENLHNLPDNYYRDQIEVNADDPDWIRRMVDNLIGFMRDGQPVYSDFDEQLHVSDRELVPWRGVALILAADAGLTPALVIMQRNVHGEAQVLAEVTSRRADAETFAESVLLTLDSPRFAECKRPTTIWVDPTALNATESSSRSEGAELSSWAKIVAQVTEMKVKASRCNNDVVIRTGSVQQLCRRRIGNRSAFRIDRTACPELIKGAARDYKYEKIKVQGRAGEEFRNKPSKNFASHVCNALEYGCANAGEQDVLTGKAERKERRQRQTRTNRIVGRGQRTNPLAGYGGR